MGWCGYGFGLTWSTAAPAASDFGHMIVMIVDSLPTSSFSVTPRGGGGIYSLPFVTQGAMFLHLEAPLLPFWTWQHVGKERESREIARTFSRTRTANLGAMAWLPTLSEPEAGLGSHLTAEAWEIRFTVGPGRRGSELENVQRWRTDVALPWCACWLYRHTGI